MVVTFMMRMRMMMMTLMTMMSLIMMLIVSNERKNTIKNMIVMML